MEKELTFLQKSACEITGQPSSKRIQAYRYGLLGIILVLTLCACELISVITGKDIPQNAKELFIFLGSAVFVSILGFLTALYGMNLSQNKAAISAGIVTDLHAVLPDCPPSSNIPVSQPPAQPYVAPTIPVQPIVQP